MKRLITLVAVLLTALVSWMAPTTSTTARAQAPTPSADSTIRGVVRSPTGPVPNATVRALAADRSATSAADGTFTLTGLVPGKSVNLSAWAPGYFVGGQKDVVPGQTDLVLELTAYSTDDNSAYPWISAFSSAGADLNCQNCHADSTDPTLALPFAEWQRDAHSQSATNPRFLSMYNGTDLKGNTSPLTHYATHRDYGRLPLPPDLTQPYYGPGFKLDFPDTTGNCAACHLPAAAVDAPYQTDPNAVTGVGREGIACDVCHKVGDVRLDPSTGLPYPNMPGVLTLEFLRPPQGQQFFAGPFDDVPPGPDTFSPLQRQSQFCAACHYGVFWGVPVYNSFGEWLASPYADPTTGKTCQDCHMPTGRTDHMARLDQGGMTRGPAAISSHQMPGAADVNLLQNSVTMTTTVQRVADGIRVQVSILNDKTGHDVPTDSPLRNILLVVNAQDAQGKALTLREGETLPRWAGDYAGRPGKGYAKILEELWTEVSPTGAYWQQTRIVSDNRLAPFAADTSQYLFTAPAPSAVVEVKLIFRRAFYDLMQQKGWTDPDILMESSQTTVP